MKRLQLKWYIFQLNCFLKLICRDIKICSFHQFNCKKWCCSFFFCVVFCVGSIWYPRLLVDVSLESDIAVIRRSTQLIKSSGCWDTSIIHIFHNNQAKRPATKSHTAQLHNCLYDARERSDVSGQCWRLNIILWELSFEEFQSLACLSICSFHVLTAWLRWVFSLSLSRSEEIFLVQKQK